MRPSKLFTTFSSTALILCGLFATEPLHAKKIKVKLPAEAYALTPEDRARHALKRLAYGPWPGQVKALSRPGALENWINGQLYPDRIEDADLERRLQALPLATADQDEIQADILKPFIETGRADSREGNATEPEVLSDAEENKDAEMDAALAADPKVQSLIDQWQRAQILRAVYSERQLEAVLGDFWFNHFNVDMSFKLGRFTVQDYRREAIQSNVFESFRDLLGATARHPAMLSFLENESSTRAANAPGLPTRSRSNYPYYDPMFDPFYGGHHHHGRYIRYRAGGGGHHGYHHHGFGHHGLWSSFYGSMYNSYSYMPGNSPQLDALMTGPIKRYARALLELHTLGPGASSEKDVTETARIFTGWSIDPPVERIAFRFNPPAHDARNASVLGRDYAGQDGESEGDELLDELAAHPATARHIAMQFARRFVGDDPPAALVNRLADRFSATDGDLRQLIVALVEAPEFWQAPAESPRTPFEWITGLLRASGAETDGRGPLSALAEMGMAPGRAPDPAGYPRDTAVWLGANSMNQRRALAARFAAGQWEGTRAAIDPGLVDPDFK